jgi:hypothetical protein
LRRQGIASEALAVVQIVLADAVRFRFLGHEHVMITEDLPDGWERLDFGKVAQLQYEKALKAENRVDGPFLVYGSSGQIGTHEKAFVEAPAIVVGRKGNVGSVYWSPENFSADRYSLPHLKGTVRLLALPHVAQHRLSKY